MTATLFLSLERDFTLEDEKSLRQYFNIMETLQNEEDVHVNLFEDLVNHNLNIIKKKVGYDSKIVAIRLNKDYVCVNLLDSEASGVELVDIQEISVQGETISFASTESSGFVALLNKSKFFTKEDVIIIEHFLSEGINMSSDYERYDGITKLVTDKIRKAIGRDNSISIVADTGDSFIIIDSGVKSDNKTRGLKVRTLTNKFDKIIGAKIY